MIKELNAGDEVQVVNPTGQGSDATSFTKLQQRMIGAGQGLSYEATSRDMSETNYASARQGAIEDEMTYQEEVEAILAILDEIYETFVISCYLAGLIKVNKDFWTKKDDYLEHGWIKSPKKWIDPLKESSANKTALNTGQKTYKEIAAENGRDWKQQIDDNLEVIEYAKKKGYDLGSRYLSQLRRLAAGSGYPPSGFIASAPPDQTVFIEVSCFLLLLIQLCVYASAAALAVSSMAFCASIPAMNEFVIIMTRVLFSSGTFARVAAIFSASLSCSAVYLLAFAMVFPPSVWCSIFVLLGLLYVLSAQSSSIFC